MEFSKYIVAYTVYHNTKIFLCGHKLSVAVFTWLFIPGDNL